jgi:hypothetical protein
VDFPHDSSIVLQARTCQIQDDHAEITAWHSRQKWLSPRSSVNEYLENVALWHCRDPKYFDLLQVGHPDGLHLALSFKNRSYR